MFFFRWSRLSRLRSNPEFQSALVRLGLWLFSVAYIGMGAVTGYYAVDMPRFFGFFGTYLFLFLALGASVMLRPEWPARRFVALVVDVSGASLAIFLTREAISPFYLLYIWLFISYGTRYGEVHLKLASVLSVLAYNLVLLALDEWQRHTYEAAFFLLLLVMLPLYQYSLLRRLHEARQEAERANRAKGDFLAAMTHELRTPLSGVIGMTRLLAATGLSPQQRDYVQSLDASAQLLRALIGDVLDLSKIEAHKVQLETRPFDLAEAVQAVCRNCAEPARDRGLTLTCRLAPELPARVVGDELRLRQILFNLVGNAVKFTERGEVVVSVRPDAGHAELAQPHVFLEVRDTGIGIPSDKLGCIFDSFWQADGSTTRRFGGTGLGTAIARDLARLMGGTIGVASEVGVGSRFWVRLPLPPAPAVQDPAGVPAASAVGEAASGPGMDVLVAEDNPIAAKVILAFLEQQGHRVTLTRDGEESLRTLCSRPYAIAFLDLRMPRLDGLELTRRYREREAPGRHLPLVALTANAAEATRRETLAAGMDAFLAKPVDPEQLAEVIRQLVKPESPAHGRTG